MLKIRKPEQAPLYFNCTYDLNKPEEKIHEEEPVKKSAETIKKTFNARFLSENFGENFKVNPGQFILKEWTFKNNGDSEWPADTKFVQTNGDNLGAEPYHIPGVRAGDEVTVSVQMMAPALPGKYCAFFRFVYGDNQRFGQKVWCDILVEEAQQEERSSLLLSEQPEVVKPLVNDAPEIKEEVVVEEKPVEEKKYEEEVKIQAEPEIVPPEVSEEEKLKLAYIMELKAANVTDKALYDNLTTMGDAGYYNFRLNYNLLNRNKNDLVVAMNKLCNFMVSDSMFEPK
jgi:hypothetical protein